MKSQPNRMNGFVYDIKSCDVNDVSYLILSFLDLNDIFVMSGLRHYDDNVFVFERLTSNLDQFSKENIKNRGKNANIEKCVNSSGYDWILNHIMMKKYDEKTSNKYDMFTIEDYQLKLVPRIQKASRIRKNAVANKNDTLQTDIMLCSSVALGLLICRFLSKLIKK